MDQLDGTLFYHSILARIQGDIETTARKLYLDTRMAISVSVDDLVQEGMIGAWQACQRYDESKVKSEKSINGYCMKYAKYAMLQWIENHKSEISLEGYLEAETERGLTQRDIEDRPVKCAETPEHKRTFVLTALSTISPMRRIVLMSSFQIEDAQGNITAKEDTGLTARQFEDARYHGLKRLRTLLKREDLVVA
jgi:RNA polymerase sigma factor (sigma-70 family)